jgi:AspT/YidE/YbjL antiporter-like protein
VSDALNIIQDPTLTYRQQLVNLARLGESTDDSLRYSDAYYAAKARGALCDLNEGVMPFRPRYICPDYELLFKNGCRFLELEAPKDLLEAVNVLEIFYCHVPSITTYPVYLGDLDRLLEPFVLKEDREYAKKVLRLFLRNIDKVQTDSFVHADIGPEDTVTGRILLELTEERPLLSGDVIQLVGDVDALNCADDLGLCEVTDPAYYQVQVVNRKLVLTKSFPTAEGAALLSGYGVLTNAGDDENAFARGKILSVTGSDVAIREVAKRMGYIKDEGNETDIAFMSLAIAVGLFVGSLAITLSDLSLSLGESVGVLLAGLVCGWLYNKNPRYGRVPQATGSFLRSLGLNLYIGALALRVGGSFREAMTGNGWLILLLGAIVTLVPHLLSLLFGKLVLKLDDTDLLGGLCGSGTCTAALNSLTEETNSSVFTFGYAPGCAAGNILLTVMGLLLPFLL